MPDVVLLSSAQGEQTQNFVENHSSETTLPKNYLKKREKL
jgi:hypothetical protein